MNTSAFQEWEALVIHAREGCISDGSSSFLDFGVVDVYAKASETREYNYHQFG
jgi:hypothetical protein